MRAIVDEGEVVIVLPYPCEGDLALGDCTCGGKRSIGVGVVAFTCRVVINGDIGDINGDTIANVCIAICPCAGCSGVFAVYKASNGEGRVALYISLGIVGFGEGLARSDCDSKGCRVDGECFRYCTRVIARTCYGDGVGICVSWVSDCYTLAGCVGYSVVGIFC